MKLLSENQRIRRWHSSDRPVIVAFWPQDFHIGAAYPVLDQWYRITRYVRCVDSRLFEVWGRAVPCPKDAADLLLEIPPREHLRTP
jgi:hypothetical protein